MSMLLSRYYRDQPTVEPVEEVTATATAQYAVEVVAEPVEVTAPVKKKTVKEV